MSGAFRDIVLAYDGSAAARGAAHAAFRIGHAFDADVLITHVLEPGGTPVHAEVLARLERRHAQESADWERELAALAGLAPAGTRTRSSVTRGDTAARLLETLDVEHASLAIAGTHGVGGVRSLLGSVSHRLVEHAPCPVLLVREEWPADGHLNVLAAIDGSPAAMEGLRLAQLLAAGLGAALRLVHVFDPRMSFDSDPVLGLLDEVPRDARRLMREARATVRAPLDEVVEELREGEPHAELIAACHEHAPAIVVVASRGVGGVRGLLLGSTARELVNHAPCPVLVTREARGPSGGRDVDA